MKTITISGKYNSAIVYATDKFGNSNDQDVLNYIRELLNSSITKHCKIKIMPNLCLDQDCITGFTMRFQGRIPIRMLGNDLGCGILAIKLYVEDEIDYLKLYSFVRNNLFQRDNVHSNFYNQFDNEQSLDDLIKSLDCYFSIRDYSNYDISLGTLEYKDKSHFIALAYDSNKDYWLIIHDGSHQLGSRISNYYINKAYDFTRNQGFTVKIPWLDSVVKSQFFNDYKIADHYAYVNRWTLAEMIMEKMNWEMQDYIHSVHNHVDVDNKRIMKGAISASLGERLVIPINIKDGFLLGTGKGNIDWNFCSPSCAGRTLYSSQAKKYLLYDEYHDLVKNIYRLIPDNRVESPECFRQIKDFAFSILDTVEIKDVIKPIHV